MIERLWRSLKQEAVYLHKLTDGFVAKRVIDDGSHSTTPIGHTRPLKNEPQTGHTWKATRWWRKRH